VLPRTIVLMLAGTIVLLAGFGLLFATAGSAGVVAGTLWGLFWNGLTFAFLPAGLAAPSMFRGAWNAFAAARRPRVWGLVVLQSLLLGFVMYLSVSGERVEIEGASRTVHRFERHGWYTTLKWLGGYENDFQWHDKLVIQVAEAPVWPLASAVLALLGLWLAMAMKFEVARMLAGGDDRPPGTTLT
jgi:hypothetical protein